MNNKIEPEKIKETARYLTLLYTLGMHPESKNNKENEACVKFAENVNREAKHESMSPLAYIDKLAESIDLKLFENKYPSLDKIKLHISRIPREIMDFTKQLNNTYLSKKNYKGLTTIDSLGEMEKWESNNIGYLISNSDYMVKLKGKAPKVYASQDKNVKLLIMMVQQQQYNKTNKKAEASFIFREYLKLRGYSDEEVSRGGKFIEECKRDLITGAIISYQVPISRDGKTYKIYGSLYQLEVPDDPRGIWTIIFNGRHGEALLDILNREGSNYFTHLAKEIADRETSDKPYLHTFYNALVYRRRDNNSTMPMKIKNLIESLEWPEKIRVRPKECFDRLRECLVYFSEKYPEELKSITIYNNYNKDKTIKIPMILNGEFKNCSYNDFKDTIESKTGLDDWQESLISFRGSGKKPKDQELKTEETIMDKIPETSSPEKKTDKTIKPGKKKGSPVNDQSINEILDYLNEKANKTHKPNEENRHLISKRLKQGYTITDLKKVIDVKVIEWKGHNIFDQYLRPSTLFNMKFENYLDDLNQEIKDSSSWGGGKRYKIVNEYISDYAKKIEDIIIKWINKTQKETGEKVSRDEHKIRTIINDSIGYNTCEEVHKLFNEESSSPGPDIIERVINSILRLDTREKLTKYDKLMRENRSQRI